MKLQEVLDKIKEMKGSDIHISVGNPIAFRIHGEIHRINEYSLNKSDVMEYLSIILNEDKMSDFKKGLDVDVAYQDSSGDRFRINVFKQKKTPAIVMRLITGDIPSMDDLGLPEVLKELALLPRGLILITGPTGSGKSTTLATMVDYINESKSKHILTLEDPIEFVYNQKKSIVNQREVHNDTESFGAALKSALREDPDVILVGEMRDFETIQLAITAAETGHLVLSTLHTTGAPDTIGRIVDSFPPHQQSQVRSQLSSSLQAVVSQVLVPKIGGGRIAAHEIMRATDAIANNIREGNMSGIEESMRSGGNQGMIQLDSSLAKLVNAGKTTKESAEEFVKKIDDFRRLIGENNR